VRSMPVALSYDVATASNDGQHAEAGFDGKGDALPAEMLPAEITFNNVRFKLAQAKTGVPNAVIAKGQTINLPAGRFNRVFLLAASAEGDQKATFDIGGKPVDLDIEDWGGFIGQWDDRQWSGKNLAVDHAIYGQMTGLKQGYIKRAPLAWYCDHHHDADGKNVTYAYSYLFGYAVDVSAGAKTIKLPQNDKIRILAISMAEENPDAAPAQPLYDVLPSPNAQPGITTYAGSISGTSVATPSGN
jgi:alpha-mannosidase